MIQCESCLHWFGEVTSLLDRLSWFVLRIADKKKKGKSLGLNWEKKTC